MQSSNEVVLRNMELLYENCFNLLQGFQQASDTALTTITVPLKDKNGVVTNYKINSFQKLQAELTRIDGNFKSMTNADNVAYILNGDGEISQFTRTTFLNAEYLSSFKFGVNAADTDESAVCVVDNTSLLKQLVFPNVKIPIYIDNTIRTNIRCRYYDVITGYDQIPTSPKIVDLEYLISQGTIVARKDEIVLPIEKEQINYFGKFTVIESTSVGNDYTVLLGDIVYTSINALSASIQLKVGDILVTKSGSAKFQISDIDVFTKIVKAKRIAGSDTIKVGVDQLYFNQTLASIDRNIVAVPITPNKNLVIFLSTENEKATSFPSPGIRLNTATYQVSYLGSNLTLDEFFSGYVTNFSEYIFALVNETSIPLSLGVQPAKVVLNPLNFSVIQINKHITDDKSTAEIQDLNNQKQQIKNSIEFNTTQINTIQQQVDTLKFKSTTELTQRLDTIATLKEANNKANANLLTITRQLDNDAIEFGLKDLTPKYRLLGFWPIQTPIFSPLTKAQHIIGYDIQYRYLSKNSSTVDSTSIKMISDGKEINVVYSSWVQQPSRILNKVANLDGTLSWEVPVLDSVTDININQAVISIQEGEAVELKVRAITEAGYPLSPMVGEWSDVLRYDFPDSLTQSSLSTIVAKNETDLRISEFNGILSSSGILKHIAGQVQEAERTFMHKADEIASGFYSPEQKIIDLKVLLTTMQADIQLLKNKEVSSNITVAVVDFNSETYTVKNNTTVELAAGNYSDSLNLLDNTKYGSIIRKQGYIKIKNANSIPIELKTFVPGTVFSDVTAANYYNVPVKTPTAMVQASKQVLYYRNIDITNQNEDLFRLVKPKLANTQTHPNPLYIDNLAIEDVKDVVYLDTDGNVKITKLIENAGTDFIAFMKDHPLYNNENKQAMLPEFARAKLYTDNVKARQYQSEMTGVDTQGLGFSDNDFYAIGQNSCGAFLYPIIGNIASISVVGNNTTSTLIIPANTEILIPFLYEFRMMDRLGRVNGLTSATINDDLTYSKKIGVDMLINNDTFKFDINVSSKLKSNVAPIETLNVSSVVSAFNNETPTTIS